MISVTAVLSDDDDDDMVRDVLDLSPGNWKANRLHDTQCK